MKINTRGKSVYVHILPLTALSVCLYFYFVGVKMYYNNFNGNRYGYGYQPMQVQQPMYQQAISIQDMPIQATRFMNEAEAKAYIVMPNQKELLIDSEKGVAYLKFADSMGQSSCRRFKFEEITNNTSQLSSSDENLYLTKSESEQFVKKADFDLLASRVNELFEPKAEPVGETK